MKKLQAELIFFAKVVRDQIDKFTEFDAPLSTRLDWTSAWSSAFEELAKRGSEYVEKPDEFSIKTATEAAVREFSLLSAFTFTEKVEKILCEIPSDPGDRSFVCSFFKTATMQSNFVDLSIEKGN